MKTLILYLTRDGQTQKIAEKIASELQQEQTDVCILSLRENPNISADYLQQFGTIVVGASIRYGHFDPLLTQFINQHYALLNQKKSAFFSVNLTARKADKNSPETNVYTRKLLARIKWQPDLVEVMAGALFYPRYRWFDRVMIRFIMKITGGETDTSREYEYTDWHKVITFSQQIRKLS
ncbi:menaquinone-dependent protoporphyrinogen IX dehydrogenase [Ursidibacter maritimus]|uniref:Protoporphyrinogen IX dehydrogenase [quinone] n=1 Tax=Ursidibacter maritimus TaxID=1331689 RepID=A0A949WJP7_9PAST|nr:menaquinone-dependent protoporphyrinogen IX dehydrogenase [Ursidibacter maritimus]KAE9541505.1 protoporphyrinogen oxidase [Ursidibacter maritimus]MBV6524696.1 menaquinone-dependent protoporphyrinogen IX dehydrogenase [Ursidibacter maritimus]MBV6526047.1 menaquinone-dependent protoporphyrinogen IX dehydrogenase [Ursidibacter maritimus]MBV6528348.1 menaquinone-dependent protoporphyrinogen IX dehydrogenase [Ursidibacter maritimus]MBV6529612.1 menaquinone-dependent protoporphyrinogen IX dehydro